MVLSPDVLYQVQHVIDAPLLAHLRTSSFTFDGLTSMQAREWLVGLLPARLRTALPRD